MTRDEIIAAARDAGFFFHDAGYAPTLHTTKLEYSEKCFERFAAIIERKASEAEREACLNACATVYYQHIGPLYGEVRYGIAKCDAAIRARNNQQHAGAVPASES